MIEAQYWKPLKNRRVECLLCPHHCVIADGKRGRCIGRVNRGGTLYAGTYGEIVSMSMDPIEKKPLYHFFPGSSILSIAPYGCNLSCPFCQNWEISQKETATRHIEPDSMVAIAKENESLGIAYTYTEPLTWFEYLLDTGKKAKAAGLKNVLVTNGMIEEEPLKELLPLVDAMNIDLKSINPLFYRNVVKGDLGTVQRTIEIAKAKTHIEITNLIIPNLNDREEEIDELIAFVVSLGKETVLHFSRYFPSYKTDIPETPVSTIISAYRKACKSLYYVYMGNIWKEAGNDTFCPRCKNRLIARDYFRARVVGIEDRKCSTCGRKVDILL